MYQFNKDHPSHPVCPNDFGPVDELVCKVTRSATPQRTRCVWGGCTWKPTAGKRPGSEMRCLVFLTRVFVWFGHEVFEVVRLEGWLLSRYMMWDIRIVVCC